MANRRMLPHSVVINNYTDENSDGEAQYLAVNLSFVFVEDLRKVSRNGVGLHPDDKLRIFIFDAVSLATNDAGDKKTYVSQKIWQGLIEEQRAISWTLADGKDKVEYEDGTFAIVSAEHHKAGSRRMWHWEVYAK